MAKSQRFLWPRVLYEARPYVAIIVGVVLAGGALGYAVSLREESTLTSTLLGLGSAIVLYGGLVKQMRSEYRNRVARIAAIKAEARQREADFAAGIRSPAPVKPAQLGTPNYGLRGAIACIVGGCVLAGVAVVRALQEGDFTVWESLAMALGSIIAVYGVMMASVHRQS